MTTTATSAEATNMRARYEWRHSGGAVILLPGGGQEEARSFTSIQEDLTYKSGWPAKGEPEGVDPEARSKPEYGTIWR